MENMKLNVENAFVCKELHMSMSAIKGYEQQVKEAQEMLHKGTGLGNDFLGWLTLPSSITEKFMDEIIAAAKV
ncbi:MAG: glucose-6-phosphate isomerase, partial [Paludibacteraceae bacterium]|nr:glucose-6-phosphate isomerase [Paludibacteraceae bacterium]